MKVHTYYYHTAEGRAERVREEERVKKYVLIEYDFDFKRQHYIDIKCGVFAPTRACAYGDFILLFRNMVVILEVDEDQHKSYGVSCDVSRMAEIVETLRVEGNTQRIVFIRYNPHGFKVDGVTKHTTKEERHRRLAELLCDLQAEEGKDDACDVRTFYLFYDTDADGEPAVFQDETYEDLAKEWFVRAIV